MPKSKSESIMERTSNEKTSRMQIGVIQYIHMLITACRAEGAFIKRTNLLFQRDNLKTKQNHPSPPFSTMSKIL